MFPSGRGGREIVGYTLVRRAPCGGFSKLAAFAFGAEPFLGGFASKSPLRMGAGYPPSESRAAACVDAPWFIKVQMSHSAVSRVRLDYETLPVGDFVQQSDRTRPDER